ncbi:hypothetical protein HanRHA438_Chr10g0453681 [Helianthus annuus]|nr:hypothetical protein HanRHA438_Chr10g0453681 [Helianthus annuus]
MGRQKRLRISSIDSNEAVEDHVKDHEASKTQDHHTSAMQGGQSYSKNVGLQMNKFMKEIAYEGVEILDNDNVGKGVEEYSAADMDDIREDWSTYAVNSIFKL